MQHFSEKVLQEIIFKFPELMNIVDEIEPYEKEKKIDQLRCDTIFKIKNKNEFVLVEMKKESVNYDDIGQVMKYYSLLTKQGYNITKVCLLGKYFEADLLKALDFCRITPILYNETSIHTAISNDYDEMKEGKYLIPKNLEKHNGTFPLLPLDMIDNKEFIIKEYEKYKNDFNKKQQDYVLEIWEFTAKKGGGCYLTSIKYNEIAIHPFNKPFHYMASKISSNSSRFSVWDYFQKEYGGIPHNKIKVYTYNPFRTKRLDHDEYTDTTFLNECVPPKYR
ncbi:hypothetical protein [Bacillus rhizoplanae]|uniref:hypothetical protein n=1 Tax=Bacillus rhizoplanae TaxID=2880966 RepID=UPI003D1961AA